MELATQMLLVGMTSVFIVLIFLSLVIWGLRELDKLFDKKKKPAAAAVAAGTGNISSTSNESNPDLVAVLTAAASVACGHNIRIEKINFLNDNKGDWVESGRFSLMSSHSITTKKETGNERK